MKKYIAILLILIFTFPIVIVYASNNSYYNKFNQIYEYENYPTLKIEAYFDDKLELSEVLKNTYEDLISKIPENIVNQLKDAITCIYFVEDAIPYFGNNAVMLAGFFNPRYKTIYINIGYSEEYDDSYDYTAYKVECVLYHEIGHALDYNLGNISCKSEFKTTFEEENNNNYRGKADSSVETFADIFDYYMWDYTTEINGYSKYMNMKVFPKCTALVIQYLNLKDIYTEYNNKLLINSLKDKLYELFKKII